MYILRLSFKLLYLWCLEMICSQSVNIPIIILSTCKNDILCSLKGHLNDAFIGKIILWDSENL